MVAPRTLRILGRTAIALGGVFLALGLAMPAIAKEFIHDPAPRAQQEVNNAGINLQIVTLNLGTKISTFGEVVGFFNITDFDFVPDDFPIKLSVLTLRHFDGSVIFVNSLQAQPGEVLVVEGFYYRITVNNTSYAVVTGTSLFGLAFSFASDLASGGISPAKVFRPWWDQTGLAFGILGLGAAGVGWCLEWGARRAAALPSKPPGPPPPAA